MKIFTSSFPNERCHLECEIVWVDDDSGSVPKVAEDAPVALEAKA